MSPIVSVIPRVLPYAVLASLAGVSLWAFVFMTVTNQEAVWVGPPMPGKRLALADIAQAKVIVGGPPLAEQGGGKADKKPVEKSKAVETKPPVDRNEYIVQVGGFLLELGANAMVEQLRKGGFDPWVESAQELVRLNDVQAGPFASQKDAKEAEAQLKAVGITAKVEETWEGFVISLSRNFALGDALQELEKAQGLGLRLVRLAKVDEERSVRKVCVGPFPSKEKAKEVSARVAKIGLTVPVIKERAVKGRSK
ncbi:MAG: SPOR domain-containing protein [Magnetococcus sp. MYC-9]